VTKGMPDTAIDGVRGELHRLEIKEVEARAKNPERHPDVQVIRKQITLAKEIIDREKQSRQQVTTGPNQLYVQAQLALMKQEPALAALRAREAELQAQLARERKRQEQFTQDQLRVARLQRDVEVREGHYRKYADTLEQARIDTALAAERISNVN